MGPPSHGPAHPPASSLPPSFFSSPPRTPTCAVPLAGHSPCSPAPGHSGAHRSPVPRPPIFPLSTCRAARRPSLERPPPLLPFDSFRARPPRLTLARSRAPPPSADALRPLEAPETVPPLMNLIGAPSSPLSPVRTAARTRPSSFSRSARPSPNPSSHRPTGSTLDHLRTREPSPAIGSPPCRSLPAPSPTSDLLSEPHCLSSCPAHTSHRPHALTLDPVPSEPPVSRGRRATVPASAAVTVPRRARTRALWAAATAGPGRPMGRHAAPDRPSP
jgi:hypothetical protein